MDKKPIYKNINSEKSSEALKDLEKINYTLYDISNAVNTTRNLEELYQSIYNSLNRLMPLPNFYIAIYDNIKKTINFEYFIDEYDDDFPIIENLDNPSCLTGEVILAKRPLFLKENMLMDRAKKNKISGTIPKIWIGVPLIIKETVIGIICVQHYSDPGYFSHRHLEILISVSDQIAIAIERKQILDKLENKEKTLSLITDHTASLVVIADSQGIYEFANPAHKTLGYEHRDLIGSSFLDLIHSDDVENILPFLEKRIPGSVSHIPMEFRMKDKNKIFQKIDGAFDLIRNEDGFLEKIVFIGKDISQIKEFEEKLTAHQKIDPIKLLAGGIAHDFNNLLSGIMGNLELLSTDQEGLIMTQKNHIANALIPCQKAVTLNRQLQALTASNPSMTSTMDIYKIAKTVFNLLGQAPSPLIKKTIEFSENQFFIKGYEEELYQVFMNLSVNALQAIEEKGSPMEGFVRIYIPKENHFPPKGLSFPDSEYLHFCFEDNGCGMTQETRKKAFDPMFSKWKTGDRKGLGLATAHYIITKKHQGSVDIETAPGKGTIFHIHLPLAEKNISEKKKDSHFETKTILVIEDEDMVRDMAVKALKAFGYNTLDACDGEAGLVLFKKNPLSIDAVLLDIIMPKMSGAETFKKMLNINPSLKVIVASGHVTNQDQKKIFSKACAYLEKPYQIMELKQTLESILK